MRDRWKLALVLLILILGIVRASETFNDWQAGESWVFNAVLSVVYLIGAGVMIWRESRGRG
ncbi:hypothetical protein L1280_002938 [Deinococcus sp. HSC-46F16]|uniref:hypothetical protein n=1 Tax=Deinococcus sp. HSC-46F16 TaxID=2910968 RepID=UPI0020A04AE4|nr:hypothetical protein [Deinococcus sp. HSC-46F16]MCP2015762.1 hypothetical protein [Deinococcus sp. HSC-46F16]